MTSLSTCHLGLLLNLALTALSHFCELEPLFRDSFIHSNYPLNYFSASWSAVLCPFTPCAVQQLSGESTRLSINFTPCAVQQLSGESTRLSINFTPCAVQQLSGESTRLSINFTPCAVQQLSGESTRLSINLPSVRVHVLLF